MQRFLIFLFIFILSLKNNSPAFSKPVGIHPSNFYLLSYQDNLFYPVGVNADFLLDLNLTDDAVQKQIYEITKAGANTFRLNIDHAVKDGKKEKENPDGTLSASVMKRLEWIIQTAQENHAVVILSMFDLLGMAKQWETHAYNQVNGGELQSFQDFFTHAQRRRSSMARIKHIIETCKAYDHVIWELARGINLDEYNSMGNPEWRKHIQQWTILMLDAIQRADDQKHLITLSFLPNTLPVDLMGFAPINMYLMHIQANDCLKAVKSTTQMLQIVKDHRLPVFVGELTWTGEKNQSSKFHQYMFWSLLASGSSAFLNDGSQTLSNEDYELINHIRFAMPLFDLSGRPRPPVQPSPNALPKGSYQLIEHICGNEWLFCLIRKTPGKNIAALDIPAQPGWFEYQWFHIENAQILPQQRRRNTRGLLKMQSPEFEGILVGRLRYLPDMEPPNATAPAPILDATVDRETTKQE